MREPRNKTRAGRWLRRAGAAFAALAALGSAALVASGWTAFGHRPEGARRERMERSPHFADGQFRNFEPLWNDVWGSFTGVFDASPDGRPRGPLPVVARNRRGFDTPPASGLRATWLGHSTVLVEIDGDRVLTDPVWGERASPFSYLGPERWYPAPLPLAEVPRLDAVVISHDHYDHLDHPTIAAMKDWDTTFVVPLGVGAHLTYWGVPEARVVELDWWQETRVGDLSIVATPARHASGRTLLDNDRTLWAGYAFIGRSRRVYFSGDTGLFPAMRQIGSRLGPFDLTLIESGAYGSAWPDWHLGPEQAVRAHRMVRGGVLVPIHWGLFNLAFHAWTEPVERLLVAAEAASVEVLVPRPGESVEPATRARSTRWWPRVPFQTAKQNPIVATRVD